LPPTLAEAAFVYGSGFVVGKGVSGYRYLRGLGKATTVAEVEVGALGQEVSALWREGPVIRGNMIEEVLGP